MADEKPIQPADPTAGAAPIVEEPRRIVIDGREYTLRRLTVADTFRILKIVAKGAGAALLADQLPKVRAMTATDALGYLAGLVLAAIPYAQQEICELLGSLIGLSGEEFAQLPMGSEIDVLNALAQTSDLQAFALSFFRLLSVNGPMQTQLQKPSTSSKPDTASETTRS